MNIQERLQGLFRDVFDNRELVISRATTAADIREWDSLNHINLIVGMEKEFEIKFGLAEIQSLQSVGDMIDLVARKRGAA
jgi:acyl carrier protein